MDGLAHNCHYLFRQVFCKHMSVWRDVYRIVGFCVDECAENPCLYGGTCTDKEHDFSCDCPNGFTGKKCQYRPNNLCKNDPCGGKGECIEDYTISKTRCICQPGYTSGKKLS